MEHGVDRPDDLLPRGRRQYAGAARPARQVREQDPDSDQDRTQLQDALALPPGRVLHPQGARGAGDAEYGARLDPPVGSEVEQADGRRDHSLPIGDESRRRSVDPELVQVRGCGGVGRAWGKGRGRIGKGVGM